MAMKTLAPDTKSLPDSLVRTPLSWGMIFLLVYTMVVIGRIQEALVVLAPLRIGLLSAGLALLVWMHLPGKLSDKIPLRVPQVRYVMLLLGLGVITVPISSWPRHSLEFVTTMYIKIIVLFLLALSLCRSLQDVRRMVWASCGGATLLTLSGILTGRIFDRDHRDDLMGPATYDPNDLALVLVVLLPLALYLYSTAKWLGRAALAGMLLIFLYGLVLTQSRGGFLALLVVGALLVWRSPLARHNKIILAVLGVLVFGGIAGPSYWDRIRTIWDPQTELDRTAGGRTEVWKTGLMIMLTHPWGVGMDGFVIAEGLTHGGRGKWSAAHNSFLQVGVDLGIAGLVIFVRLLLETIKELRAVQRHPQYRPAWVQSPAMLLRRSMEPLLLTRRKGGVNGDVGQLMLLASMLEISFIGFMVGGFFLSQAYGGILYFLIAMSLVCTRIARRLFEPSDIASDTDRREPWRRRLPGSPVPFPGGLAEPTQPRGAV